MTEEYSENQKKKGKWHGLGSNAISLGALVISVISVAISWWWNSSIGDVTPLEPSGYAIVRGIDPTFEDEPEPGKGLGVGPYPADHVVLPLEWANSSGSSVIVKSPVLVFQTLGRDGEPTGDEREFFMVGELPEMSAEVFNGVNSKGHTFKNSLILEPHAVSQSMSVFRVEGWDKEPNQCFRFQPGERYRLRIQFRRIPEDPTQAAWWKLTGVGRDVEREALLVDRLTVQTTADFISPYGRGESIGWDFYSLLPGSRSRVDATPSRGAPEFRYTEQPPCA